jgi:hypothetical protein
MSKPRTAAEIRASAKDVHRACMAAVAAATAVTTSAAAVGALLKKPGVTVAEMRSARAELQSRLAAYKTAAVKAVATSRLAK